MKIKISNLSLTQLDWAVAKCEGLNIQSPDKLTDDEYYSTNWAQGGPIIEREEIGIKRKAPCFRGREWEASPSITAKGAGGHYGYGPTPLIAAMRCYVSSKSDEEIEIPDEL